MGIKITKDYTKALDDQHTLLVSIKLDLEALQVNMERMEKEIKILYKTYE